MAAGEGGKNDAVDEPAVKAKKNSKAAATFFTPLSKKTKVAAKVESDKKVDVVEEKKDDDDFQVLLALEIYQCEQFVGAFIVTIAAIVLDEIAL